MWSFGCKHDYKVICKTYAPPAISKERGFSMDKADMDLLTKLLCGLTTVLLQCQKCHRLEKKELAGKEEHETH